MLLPVQSGRPELGGKAGALHITLDHAHDTERVRRGTACVRWPPASTLTSSRNPTVRGFDLLTSDTWVGLCMSYAEQSRGELTHTTSPRSNNLLVP